MKKFFLTCLLFYSASSFSQFSNMIVFGDSLSDGGNFPESQKIWRHDNEGKTLDNSVPQLYVPFSNPIDTASPAFSFTWPPLNNAMLEKQAPIENNSNPRKYRSISWPQFFLNMAEISHLVKSSIISPSNLLNTRKIPANFSFNYAWGYAMSTQNCVNPYYQPTKLCDAKSIYQARKNYEENPNVQNYKLLEIPGLFEQMKLFVNDVRANKVSVDKNTIYVFRTAGNDLIVAVTALYRHYNPLPSIQFILGFSSENILKNISLLHYSLPKEKRPKIVYVFNLYNPELTPGFRAHPVIAAIGKFEVLCSNFWLELDAKIFNLFSHTKVMVVPTYQWYENSSKSDYFKAHLGEACQIKGGNYDSPTVIPKSNCAGYQFWNSVHPAAPMNVFEANQFLNILISDKTV